MSKAAHFLLLVLLQLHSTGANSANPCDADGACLERLYVDRLANATDNNGGGTGGFVMSPDGAVFLSTEYSETSGMGLGWDLRTRISRNESNLVTVGGTEISIPAEGPIFNSTTPDANVVTCASYWSIPGECSSSQSLLDSAFFTFLENKAAAFFANGLPNASTACNDFWAIPIDQYPAEVQGVMGTQLGVKTVVSYNNSERIIPLAQFLYDIPGDAVYNGANLDQAIELAPESADNYTAYDRAINARYNWMILRYVDPGSGNNVTQGNATSMESLGRIPVVHAIHRTGCRYVEQIALLSRSRSSASSLVVNVVAQMLIAATAAMWLL